MGFDKFIGNSNARSWNDPISVTLFALSILTAFSLLMIEIFTVLADGRSFKNKMLVAALCNIFIAAILLDIEVRYSTISYGINYWVARLLAQFGMFVTMIAEVNLLRSFIFMSNFLSIRLIRAIKAFASLVFFSAAVGDIIVRS